MRKIILATAAVLIMSAPLAAPVRAEDTTVIKKDDGFGDSKTVIEKHDDRTIVREPTEEKKVIIHHDD